MPIRRCPYCKAIIEEGAEFCSNCGTQLLFPDDERIEEEIPGEKILDDKQDEEEVGVSGAEDEDMNSVGEKEESSEQKAKTPSEAIEEEEISEENSVDLEEKEAPHRDAAGGIDSEEQRKERDSDEDEGPGGDAEDRESAEISKEINSSELEKREIAKFIASIKRDRGEDKEPMTPLRQEDSGLDEEEPESPPILDDSQEFEESIEEQAIEEVSSPLDTSLENEIEEDSPLEEAGPQNESQSTPPGTPGSELFKKKELRVPTDSLPPWASRIKDDLTPETPLTDKEKEEQDVPLKPEEEPKIQEDVAFEEPIPSDTGAGLPEGITQKNLPFSESLSEEKGKILRKKTVRLLTWFKCRLFDIMILAVVWLIAVWIASFVMGVGLFRLISASALLLGIFYAILSAGYFFLFFFFLGETLGDYIFSEKRKFESRRPT